MVHDRSLDDRLYGRHGESGADCAGTRCPVCDCCMHCSGCEGCGCLDATCGCTDPETYT